MSYVDVLIPAVCGLLMSAAPHLFTKRTLDSEDDRARQEKLRRNGFILLGVATVYFLIKLAEQ